MKAELPVVYITKKGRNEQTNETRMREGIKRGAKEGQHWENPKDLNFPTCKS